MAKKKRSSRGGNGGLDVLALLFSVIAGVLWYLVGEYLLTFASWGILPRTVAAGLYFTGLALVLWLALRLSALVGGYTRVSSANNLKTLAVVGAILVFSVGSEALYDTNFKITVSGNASGYVFMLDDSSSMSRSDPDMERKDAVYSILEDKSGNFPFCVYSFTNMASRIQDVITVKELDDADFQLYSNGSTYICSAVDTVLEDIESGEIDLGKSPEIIIISDGEDSSSAAQKAEVTERAVNDGVTISAVGVGKNSSYPLLEQLSSKTDGGFTVIDDVDELESAMVSVLSANSGYRRNLLNAREVSGLNGLYMVIRLAAFLILGFLFFLLKSYQTRGNAGDATTVIIVSTIVVTVISALGIEVGMNILYLSPSFMRLLFCICFELIITVKSVKKPVSGEMPFSGDFDVSGFGSNQNSGNGFNSFDNNSSWG